MTTRATRVRRRTAWGLVVALGVAALVVITLTTSVPDQLLDPEQTSPNGGRALAEVLRGHGVQVEVVRSHRALPEADPAAGTTVVVADSTYLGFDSAKAMGHAVTDADRLVLLSPTAAQLAALEVPLVALGADGDIEATADCVSTVARRDDRISGVDVRFVPADDAPPGLAVPCFGLPNPRDEHATRGSGFAFGAAMVTVPATAGRPEVVAMGFASGFTNRRVDDASNAGLAVRALGHSRRLIWYQPGISDLADFDSATAPTPWPAWLAPGAAVGAIALVALAFVRGRRMGPLVPEPLPVVVRAVETTESRGRLYRRSGDRDRAAAILRLATAERLARRLAVSPRDVAAVGRAAATAAGMPPEHVAALLTGAPPTTDVELQTLAGSLSELEERVHTS